MREQNSRKHSVNQTMKPVRTCTHYQTVLVAAVKETDEVISKASEANEASAGF